MLQRTIDKLLGRQRRKESVMWVQERVSDGRRVVHLGVGATSPLWPTFIAAAGAGVAFWWWTQWSRGQSEAKLAQENAGGEGPAVDHPELVMAHAPEPSEAPIGSVDAADAGLVEPADQLMAHAPVDDTPALAPSKPKTPRKAAVKASASAPKGEAPPAAKPASARKPKPAAKGPTVM
jgi:hypothetical protein